MKTIKTTKRLDAPVTFNPSVIHSVELINIRDFIVEKCIENHTNNNEYVLQREILNGTIPATTSLCIASNSFAGHVLNGTKSTWRLVGGFCLSTELHPGKMFKKGSFTGDGPWLYDGWIISEDRQRMYGAHWWLESETHILDFTADQFGHDNIILCSVDDARYVHFSDYEKTKPEMDYQEESLALGRSWAQEFDEGLAISQDAKSILAL